MVQSDKNMRSDKLLSKIKAVTVVLDNGTKARLRMATEFKIPQTRRQLERMQMRSPNQLAFWSHQYARARRAFYIAEREFQTYRAESIFGAAMGTDNNREVAMTGKDRWFVEAAAESSNPKLRALRKVLDAARYQMDLLKEIRESMFNRCLALTAQLKAAARDDAQPSGD